MQMDDMILISVDDHVIEPRNLFEGHLTGEALERAPRVVTREDGSDRWVFEGIDIPNIALNAIAGRPRDQYNFEPTCYGDVRPGCYDIHERVRDMSANGVLGSLCFPSMTGFCGQLFTKTPDRALGLRILQAYNDWAIADWAGAYPDRIIPMAVVPGWDSEAMGAEVRRVAELGCHAVSFSENPAKLGMPSLHSDHWNEFWKACSDTGTIVNMHIGSSSSLTVTAPDAPVDVFLTLPPVNAIITLGDLLFSRVLRDFPDLTIALSEGGCGWIPWLIDRCDFVYENHRAWTHQDFGAKRPSDIFAERIVACFVDDPSAIDLKHRLNWDNVCWECDYPHSDSTWPNSPESVEKQVGSRLTDDELNRMTHLNAMRIYQFDPLKYRDREASTVGALRREAGDVVTTWEAERHVESDPSAKKLNAALAAVLQKKED